MSIIKTSEQPEINIISGNNNISKTQEGVSKKVNGIIKGRNGYKILKDFIDKNIGIIGNNISKCDFSQLEEDLGIKVQILYKKIVKTNHPYFDPYASSDSSVLALNDKQVLKIYDRLGVQEIKKYTEIHNLIASKGSYSFNLSGEIRGEKFDSIEVDILKLDPKLIFGNKFHSFSIVDFITPIQTRIPLKNIQDLFDLELNPDDKIKENLCDNSEYNYDDEYFIKGVINHINISIKEIGIKIPTLHQMNFMIRKIENGVLKVTITDTGNTIGEFLDENKDYFDNIKNEI